MNLSVGILFILLGLIFIVASLLDKRRADNADQELIESLFRKGVYYTHEVAHQGVVMGLIAGVVFLVLGIIFLLI